MTNEKLDELIEFFTSITELMDEGFITKNEIPIATYIIKDCKSALIEAKKLKE